MTAGYAPFTSWKLQLLVAVADHGGVTRAAEASGVGQPTVSRAIRDLQREAGVPLTTMVGRHLVLTDAGHLLVDYGRRIGELDTEAHDRLAGLQGLEQGQLVVGASTMTAVDLLPRILGDYRRRFPGIELALRVGNSAMVTQWLRDRAVDLALVDTATGADLLSDRCWPYDLVLVTSMDHRFVRVGADIWDLKDEPFLAREEGSGTRAVVEEALARHGVTPKVYLEIGNTEAIKQTVAAGLGISILPRALVRREQLDRVLAVIEVREFTLARWSLLVLRNEPYLSYAAVAFREVLADHGCMAGQTERGMGQPSNNRRE